MVGLGRTGSPERGEGRGPRVLGPAGDKPTVDPKSGGDQIVYSKYAVEPGKGKRSPLRSVGDESASAVRAISGHRAGLRQIKRAVGGS